MTNLAQEQLCYIQSHSLLMTMHHYHMILVRVLVLQNLSTQLAVLAGGGIVEGFNVSPAAAPCPKFFSTAEATPSTTTLQCHDWLTFLIYFTSCRSESSNK